MQYECNRRQVNSRDLYVKFEKFKSACRINGINAIMILKFKTKYIILYFILYYLTTSILVKQSS